MDPPPEEEAGTEEAAAQISRHIVQLVHRSRAQRTLAASRLADTACGPLEGGGSGGGRAGPGPLRRAEAALLGALLEGRTGGGGDDKPWRQHLLQCLGRVLDAHPSLSLSLQADTAASFSAADTAITFVQDKLKSSNSCASFDSIDAALSLLAVVAERVLRTPRDAEGEVVVAGGEMELAAAASIAGLQLALLDRLMRLGGCPEQRRGRALDRVRHWLQTVAARPAPGGEGSVLAAVYLPVWLSPDNAASAAGAGVLLQAAAAKVGGDRALYESAVRPAAIEVYTKRVLSSKDFVPDATLASFLPLFADMSVAEWGGAAGSLPAALARHLKKAPETAARIAAAACRQLACCTAVDAGALLAPAGGGVGAICLRLLRSPDEAVRQHGVGICTSLLSACRGEGRAARRDLLLQLCDALTAKGGAAAISGAGQRAAALQVLWFCRPASPAEAGAGAESDAASFGPGGFTAQVVGKLMAVLEKEAAAAAQDGAGAEERFGGVGSLALLAAAVGGHWMRAELRFAAADGAGGGATALVAGAAAVLSSKAGAGTAAATQTARCFSVLLAAATEVPAGPAQEQAAFEAYLGDLLEPLSAALLAALKDIAKKAVLLHIDGPIVLSLLLLVGRRQAAAGAGAAGVLEALSAARLFNSALGPASFLWNPLMTQFATCPPMEEQLAGPGPGSGSVCCERREVFGLVAAALLRCSLECAAGAAVHPAAAADAPSAPLLKLIRLSAAGGEGEGVEESEGRSEKQAEREEAARPMLRTLAACAVWAAGQRGHSAARSPLGRAVGEDAASLDNAAHFTALVLASVSQWVMAAGAEVEQQQKEVALDYKLKAAAGADAAVADMPLPSGLPSRILTPGPRGLRLLPAPALLAAALGPLLEQLCALRVRRCLLGSAAGDLSAADLFAPPACQRALLQAALLAAHPLVSGRNSWERVGAASAPGAARLLRRLAEAVHRSLAATGAGAGQAKFGPGVARAALLAGLLHAAAINRRAAQLAVYLLMKLAPEGEGGAMSVFLGLSEAVQSDVLPAAIERIDAALLAQFSPAEVDMAADPYKHLRGDGASAGLEVAVGEIKITNADRKSQGGKRKGAAFGAAADDEELLEKIRFDKAKKAAGAGGAAGGDDVQRGLAQRQAEVDAVQARVRAVMGDSFSALEGVGEVCLYLQQGQGQGQGGEEAAALSRRLGAMVAARTAPRLPHLLSHRLTSARARALLGALAGLAAAGSSLAGRGEELAAAYALACCGDPAAVPTRVIYFLDQTVVGNALAAGIKHARYSLEGEQAKGAGSVSVAALCLLVPVLVSPFHVFADGAGAGEEPPEDAHVVLSAAAEPALRCLHWLWPEAGGRVFSPAARLLAEAVDPLLRLVLAAGLVAHKWCRPLPVDPSPEAVLLRVTCQRLLTPAEWAPLTGNRGMLNSDARVRLLCLRCVQNMLTHGHLLDGLSPALSARMWMLLHDADKDVCALAERVFREEPVLCVDGGTPAVLYPMLAHREAAVRLAAARAIAACLFACPASADVGASSGAGVSAMGVLREVTALYFSSVPAVRRTDDNLLSGRGGKLIVKGAEAPLKGVGKKAGGAASASMAAPVPRARPAPASTPAMLFTRGAVAGVLQSVGAAVAAGREGAEPGAALCVAGAAAGAAKAALARTAADLEFFTAAFDFLLDAGAVDGDEAVRDAMIAAGRALIDGFGSSFGDLVQSRLQAVLSLSSSSKPSPNASEEDVASGDARRAAAVVLLGAAGKHISLTGGGGEDGDGERLAVLLGIVDTLLAALDTPAASIQKAVADCLVPLVQAAKTKAPAELADRMAALLTRCLEGRTYATRRGAAFGLSAMAKGMGVQSLKQYDLVGQLKEACSSGSVEAREGALFAFELLSDRLGLLFEPYVISVIPILLKSFSHPSNHVREAAQGTAGAIMGRLSAHGVKQVLMPILHSLPEEAAWKSRQEALRLLGSMAHCAPRQLAACLPQIIPRLVEAGSDPHPKVKESARAAMADISSVIRNPEVAQLGPVLLAALGDPANKTKDALEALMHCEFMHSIDAPSLGLLVPILARALRDRAADLKRKSALITGNMCAMITDQSVLVPYLPQVVPELKEVLLDPLPDVRTVAAKALASLVGGVGEAQLPDLVPWMLTAMASEASSVERSGAAQGLAEVCHAIGPDRLLAVLETVLGWGRKKAAAQREGAMWLLSFLPAVYNQGDEFVPHISMVLPVILTGLSDTQENVREVAMRAAQVLVGTQGKRHSGLILPSLQSGMSDADWRIRQNSVSLLGELMYLLSDSKAVGVTDGQMAEEEEEGGVGSTNSRVLSSIREILGDAVTDEVLAELYLARSDVGSTVRQAALTVWKSVVSQTPKTLVVIMPYLVDSIIRKLSDDSEDRRAVAATCLSDLVRKLGDRVLPVIVPHLRRGLDSPDLSVRRGVCMGLSEILSAAGRAQVDTYIDSLVPALEVALCDESSADIRHQGAIAFQTLVKVYGPEATHQVLPTLLARLAAPGAISIAPSPADGSASSSVTINDTGAMLGICELVSAKPRDVLDALLPLLTAAPMTAARAAILQAVCPAARGHLNYYFQTLVPQLIKELSESTRRDAEGLGQAEGQDENSVLASHKNITDCASVVMSAATTQGVNFLVIELGKQIDRSMPTNIALEVSNRRWALWLLAQFLSESQADYLDYLTIILRQLLARAADSDISVLQSILLGLRALAGSLTPEDLLPSLDFIQSCVTAAFSDAKHRAQNLGTATCQLVTASDGSGELWLPLFTQPKALDPLMPLFIHALMNGNTAQREAAANAIGEFASFSEPSVLKPHLIKTTGPLIRVAGDRFPSSVKFAILRALCILLRKGGAMLKAFVPQLQTTFVKSFSDPSRQVRSQGAAALGLLMDLNPKPDVVLTELSAICVNVEAAPLRTSALEAISTVLDKPAGAKSSARALAEVALVIAVGMADPDESVRGAAVAVCAAFGRVAPAELVAGLGRDILQKGATAGQAGGGYSSANSSAYVGSCCAAAALIGTGTAGDRCPEALCAELLALVAQGLQRADGDGAVKLAVQGACAGMISNVAEGGVAARLLRTLVPLLLLNVADEANYEIRRTAMMVVRKVSATPPYY
jgi:hypothetical protein